MLLPCPFCGEQLVEKGDIYLTWFVHDDESRCLLRLIKLFDDGDKATWNRRVTTLGDLERLLGAEVRHKVACEIFGAVSHIEDLPLPAQEYVVRHKEDSFRDGWELGFIAGCSKAVFRAPAGREVAERFTSGTPIQGFRVGDTVDVAAGDGLFRAGIVAAFPELWGASRFVVEDHRGVLHVYGVNNLRPVAAATAPEPVEQVA